jgi:hypothetical protein
MMRRWALVSLSLVYFSALLLAATPASFRGKVIEVASPQPDPNQHIIFVISRNGALRKVEVGAAKVVFSEDIPEKDRAGEASSKLKHGAEVRVIAEENGHGLWKARSVEILSLPGAKKPAPKLDPRLDDPPSSPVLSKRSL